MSFESSCKEIVDSGLCKANCCGPQIVNIEFFEKNKDKIIKNYKLVNVEGSKYVGFMTDDMQCVFLDSNNHCVVYEERPEVCREFGSREFRFYHDCLLQCPFLKSDGSRRNRKNRKKLQQMIDSVIKQMYKRIDCCDDSNVIVEDIVVRG